MKYRLTAHYVYFDGQHGYEALGHDAYSQRPFIEITKKLALYEDTEYTPEEIGQLRKVAVQAKDRVETLEIVARENYRMYENTLTENALLRKVVDAARDLPCPIWEHSNAVEDKLWDTFITTLAELEKEECK